MKLFRVSLLGMIMMNNKAQVMVRQREVIHPEV
jgi:hypothetical protein